jgi:hypothetical protein
MTTLERAIEARAIAEAEAYATDAGSLYDLASQIPALGIALFEHFLAECPTAELHAENMIRADRDAMDRITGEVERAIAAESKRAKEDAAEYAGQCARDAA